MKYAALLFAAILVAGCAAPEDTANNTSGNVSNVPSTINEIYQNEFLASKRDFQGSSIGLYDIEVRLKSGGHINISENGATTEYFRVDFSVTNHRNVNITFPYEANITEGIFPNIVNTGSDGKSTDLGEIGPGETMDGYMLFRNYHARNRAIELKVTGGYREYGPGSINFRFSIILTALANTSLEKIPLDFSEKESNLPPNSVLIVKIPANGTYTYILNSHRNVSVDVWPPGTDIDTMRFGNSTYNGTCSFRLLTNATRECLLGKDYILSIKRITSVKTQDLEGTTLSFYLFRAVPITAPAGSLKYTGQVTGDTEKTFLVL